MVRGLTINNEKIIFDSNFVQLLFFFNFQIPNLTTEIDLNH